MRLLVISLIAITLMVLDLRLEQFDRYRSVASLLVYPLQKVVDIPIGWLKHANYYMTSHHSLVKENIALKEASLLHKGGLQKLQSLQAENARLKELLKSAAETKETLLVANILHVDPDPFTHQVILNKGAEQGVYIGQPIIDANGVMGAVIGVNTYTCRVMLLTDASMAVPVESLRNGVRAIAGGSGAIGRLDLQHVPNTVDIAVGDVMVTSGLGGRYPAGYPVGTITYVGHDPGKPFATIHLSPNAHLERSRQVLLVQQDGADKKS